MDDYPPTSPEMDKADARDLVEYGILDIKMSDKEGIDFLDKMVQVRDDRIAELERQLAEARPTVEQLAEALHHVYCGYSDHQTTPFIEWHTVEAEAVLAALDRAAAGDET